eukprot:gene15765-biopygen23220
MSLPWQHLGISCRTGRVHEWKIPCSFGFDPEAAACVPKAKEFLATVEFPQKSIFWCCERPNQPQQVPAGSALACVTGADADGLQCTAEWCSCVCRVATWECHGSGWKPTKDPPSTAGRGPLGGWVAVGRSVVQ